MVFIGVSANQIDSTKQANHKPRLRHQFEMSRHPTYLPNLKQLTQYLVFFQPQVALERFLRHEIA